MSPSLCLYYITLDGKLAQTNLAELSLHQIPGPVAMPNAVAWIKLVTEQTSGTFLRVVAPMKMCPRIVWLERGPYHGLHFAPRCSSFSLRDDVDHLGDWDSISVFVLNLISFANQKLIPFVPGVETKARDYAEPKAPPTRTLPDV